jgi:hypothetical protein
MKKSKEQVIAELYVDQPGFWFSSDEKHATRHYWGLDKNIRHLSPTYLSWRRSQTDWASVANLTIYDRYGSKISWDENCNAEYKLSDVGLLHSKLWSYKNKEEVDAINRLYPVRE